MAQLETDVFHRLDKKTLHSPLASCQNRSHALLMKSILLCVASCLASCAGTLADDWPQWLGPERTTAFAAIGG